jgi:protein ImuA
MQIVKPRVGFDPTESLSLCPRTQSWPPVCVGITPKNDAGTALVDLRERLRRLEPGSALAGPDSAVTFGDPAIDALMPWGGLRRGGLHEVAGDGGDAASFGFAAALLTRFADRGNEDNKVLWCRSRRFDQETGQPYGPGLARFGLRPAQLLLVEVSRPADVLWAMEEGLRCRGLAAVLGEGVLLDLTASRRLQLAAEAGGTTALLLPRAVSGTSVALTRWRVKALPGRPQAGGGLGRPRWQAALWRCRGGRTGEWCLEWHDETLRFAVVAALADRPLAAAV